MWLIGLLKQVIGLPLRLIGRVFSLLLRLTMFSLRSEGSSTLGYRVDLAGIYSDSRGFSILARERLFSNLFKWLFFFRKNI